MQGKKKKPRLWRSKADGGKKNIGKHNVHDPNSNMQNK